MPVRLVRRGERPGDVGGCGPAEDVDVVRDVPRIVEKDESESEGLPEHDEGEQDEPRVDQEEALAAGRPSPGGHGYGLDHGRAGTSGIGVGTRFILLPEPPPPAGDGHVFLPYLPRLARGYTASGPTF